MKTRTQVNPIVKLTAQILGIIVAMFLVSLLFGCKKDPLLNEFDAINKAIKRNDSIAIAKEDSIQIVNALNLIGNLMDTTARKIH